ncbi:MAG: type II toxin-antitoxin system VapC family toxin [Lentisphaeria bacterium]
MVIDSSAVIAILLGEPEAARLAHAIAAAPVRLMSSFSALECALVIEAKKGEAGGRELDLLLLRAGVEISAFDADQQEIARDAWRRFGKGRHPAGLNIGDCCAYALTVAAHEKLLFKGTDFTQTDIPAVLY